MGIKVTWLRGTPEVGGDYLVTCVSRLNGRYVTIRYCSPKTGWAANIDKVLRYAHLPEPWSEGDQNGS